MDDSWKEKCKHLSPEEIKAAEDFLKRLPETATEVDPKSEHGDAGIAYAMELVEKAVKRHDGPVDENTLARLSAFVLDEANQAAEGCKGEGTPFGEMQKIRFEETGNPLFAWLAVQSEVGKSNLPEWLKGYLQKCAADVLDLAVRAVDDTTIEKKTLDNRVKKAFQFEGRRHLTGFVDWMRNWDVYWSVEEERERGNVEKKQGYYSTEEVAKKYPFEGRHVTKLAGRERKFQGRFKKELFGDDE